MPELPEVQIVVNGLNRFVKGRRIEQVHLHWKPYLSNSDETELVEVCSGRIIGEASRLGKYIFLAIGEHVLQVHLRMTGVLRVVPIDEEPAPHTHMQFVLNDTNRLDFSDTRKFGRVKLLHSDGLSEHQRSLGLGPDPILQSFSADDLAGIAGNRTKSIKNILLDQKLVAGIGNIYAAEILYKAGVHPGRPGKDLKEKELGEIARYTKEVLKLAIVNGGSSINDYMQVSGEKGTMQNYFTVYAQAGSECPRCGDTITKVIIGGRGSYFCPGCQK